MRYIVLVLMFLLSQDVSAYIDPGTGSLFIQVLIAGLLGLVLTVKSWWSRLLDFIKNLLSGRK
ncbi:MAG: hypothetical protein ABH834_02200 [Candidatus Altiarchaeota archaeon]